jgi:hypothetical protein
MRAPRSSRLRDLLRASRARLAAADPAARAGTILAALSVLLAFGVALRGIAGPVPNGHFASIAAIGMAADNMWRWHTVLPIVGYADHMSTGTYMHHPLGLFWDIALLGKVFGFHEWVLRLPAVFYVTLTPFFLYRIGREVWGPIEGGLTALAYVALPITIVYANYHDLEQPYIFGCVVATWGYVRFIHSWRERYLWASTLGFFFALNHAWWGYLWAAFFIPWIFLRGFVLPERWLGAVRARAFGRYCAFMCGAMGAALLLEVYLLKDSGRLQDVLTSFVVRRGDAASTPLAGVLASRAYRIELMFTGLGILLGKIAVPIIAARVVLRRRDTEALPLFFLFAAVVHYVAFQQGAAVHIFWPHTFAPYFALAVGALAASAREAAAWLAKRATAWTPARARAVSIAALAVVGLPVLFVLRDGLSLVRFSRETGGRFAEANLESEIDKGVALRWFLARLPPNVNIGFHAGFPSYWELQWDARPRPIAANQQLPTAAFGARVYVLDSRTAPVADLRAVATRFHVHAVGPFWFVDRQEPAAPLDGYSFDEREPGWWARWSQGDVEPLRSVRPDPWVTWEWRTAFGQPATAPGGTPATDDQLRIAHNVALAAGDTGHAAKLRAALSTRMNMPLRATYGNGTELIGGVHARGAQRNITLYFVAGKFDGDAKYVVEAKVIARPFLSTLPVDPATLDLARGPVVPTSLWRPGHLHAIRFTYRRRPGAERLTGSWSPGPPRTDTGHDKPIEIARLR